MWIVEPKLGFKSKPSLVLQFRQEITRDILNQTVWSSVHLRKKNRFHAEYGIIFIGCDNEILSNEIGYRIKLKSLPLFLVLGCSSAGNWPENSLANCLTKFIAFKSAFKLVSLWLKSSRDSCRLDPFSKLTWGDRWLAGQLLVAIT